MIIETITAGKKLVWDYFFCYRVTIITILCTLFYGYGNDTDTPKLIEYYHYKTFFRVKRSSLKNLSNRHAWAKVVPQIKKIHIRSTADGTMQTALYYDSRSDRRKPLLVALHSWSEGYEQHSSIPYGLWAVANDWILVLPDYRGPFNNSKSTGSELAIQDILDAVTYGKEHSKVDTTRIYITGFSGGGMATLIMVGRYPEIWAGAAAWVPVYNLPQWYVQKLKSPHNYAEQIRKSCGGPPLEGTAAYEECTRRSVSNYLRNAREKAVQVFIGTGIRDLFVAPGHSLLAFNDLANIKDQFSHREIDYINEHFSLPQNLMQDHDDPLFSDVNMPLLFERKSANVVLKIYDGNHDIIYNAGLFWLSKQKK